MAEIGLGVSGCAGVGKSENVSLQFQKQEDTVGFVIEEMRIGLWKQELVLNKEMSSEAVRTLLPAPITYGKYELELFRDRCLLAVRGRIRPPNQGDSFPLSVGWHSVSAFTQWLRGLVHLPCSGETRNEIIQSQP